MKVGIYLAKGFEEIEALTVADILRRAEVDAKLISIEETLEVTGAHNIKVIADKLISQVDYNDLDMIVLPGGMPGTLNLGNNKELEKIILDFDKNKKYIAAICAAPSILGKLNILNNKEATCYPGFEDKLKGAKIIDKRVVCSNHIITSHGPGSAMEFSVKLVEVIKGKTLAKELSEDLLLNSEKLNN